MLELGADSVAEHDAIGPMAVRLDVSRLVAVGAGARALHTGAVMEGSWGEESVHVPDLESAYELLRRELREGDVLAIPNGVAHQFVDVSDPFLYFVVKVAA
jgi:UDP-N-acetylmuramoyl-tripeptide--D-alanyl-D-alanine ligase